MRRSLQFENNAKFARFEEFEPWKLMSAWQRARHDIQRDFKTLERLTREMPSIKEDPVAQQYDFDDYELAPLNADAMDWTDEE
jgi:hypothetical protein